MLDFLKKVKDNVVAVLSVVIAILFGWLMYEKSQKDAAEALEKNQEDQKKLNALDSDIAKNDGLEQAEAEKRKQIEEETKRKQNEQASKEELLRYLNDPNSK